MIYTAGHLILLLCDSKRENSITEPEVEQVTETLKDFLMQFIRDNTKFNPFTADVMFSNLSGRLRGDQCMISIKISYITDMPDGKKRFEYITDLDGKQFLHDLKQFNRTYEILDRNLDLDTFILHTGEYKDLEFCLGFGEEPRNY